MKKIRESKFGMVKLASLSTDLIQNGFTENEIDLAFSWLFEKVGHDDKRLAALASPLPFAI